MPCKFDLPLNGLDWLQWYEPHKVFHPGIDLNSGSGDQDLGNPVFAARDGVVEHINTTISLGGGLGKFIIIRHADGNYTRYAHLDKVLVNFGAELRGGDKIGEVGKTGPTDSAHLHFEVFGEEMAIIQRNHPKTWAYYPTRQSKAYVERYYVNPWQWLEAKTEISDWAKVAAEKAQTKGIIVKGWDFPQRKMPVDATIEFSLQKLGLRNEPKGYITQEEWAVILDKAKLLD